MGSMSDAEFYQLCQQFTGSPLSALLAALELKPEQIIVSDEPPGQIRGVLIHRRDSPLGKGIWILFERDPDLYSLDPRVQRQLALTATMKSIGLRPWWSPEADETS